MRSPARERTTFWPGVLGWIGVGGWVLGFLLLLFPVTLPGVGKALERQVYFSLVAAYGWLSGNLVRGHLRYRLRRPSEILVPGLLAAGPLLLGFAFVADPARQEEPWTFPLGLLIYATFFLLPFLLDRKA